MQQLNRSLVENKKYTERILQFGEGNFLRAFADWMIDRMNKQVSYDSGVVVVQPIEQGLGDLLNQQEGLYNLYLNGLKGGEAVRERYLIDCITRCLNPYSDFEAYLQTATQPEMRLVISNTTEAGITFSEADKADDTPPATFPAKLTAWLYRRYQHFSAAPDKGMILIPCELIDRNGDKLRETILQYAESWQLEAGFADWVQQHNTFCNTLVDRIVPGYPKDRMKEITSELGYQDKLVAEGEHFHLWVIEGPEEVKKAFPAAKAGLNVVFTTDQSPYRTRKVRILNGAHTSMVPVGYLYGLHTVRETVEHPVVGGFVRRCIFKEIISTLDLPEDELLRFAKDVTDRFRNPFVKHFLLSISLNSFSKYRTRVLPSVLEYQKRSGQFPEMLVLSLGALIFFYKGERNGEAIPLKDDAPVLELMASLWEQQGNGHLDFAGMAEKVLAFESVWGQDLNHIHDLHGELTFWLQEIDRKGVVEILRERLR